MNRIITLLSLTMLYGLLLVRPTGPYPPIFGAY